MKRHLLSLTTGLLLMTSVLAGETVFAREYEVTVTNLTRGQTFTPILVASHKEGASLLTLGNPASSELAILAEEGNTAPLTSLLSGMADVKDVADSGALLNPGASVTVSVQAGGKFDHVSVAAMLIPTNDGFFALNGVMGPTGDKRLTFFSVAYDSGSERNDELCASIPGPNFVECGGPGGGAVVVGGEEGYVHYSCRDSRHWESERK